MCCGARNVEFAILCFGGDFEGWDVACGYLDGAEVDGVDGEGDGVGM